MRAPGCPTCLPVRRGVFGGRSMVCTLQGHRTNSVHPYVLQWPPLAASPKRCNLYSALTCSSLPRAKCSTATPPRPNPYVSPQLIVAACYDVPIYSLPSSTRDSTRSSTKPIARPCRAPVVGEKSVQGRAKRERDSVPPGCMQRTRQLRW
jgi:hypothetical protein